MDASRQKEIAAMGGRASHKLGRGHEWNRDAAREAGRKGGLASHSARRKRIAEAVEAAPATATADASKTEEPT